MTPEPEPPSKANPWRTLSSRPIYENAWIRVREDHVLRPDGQPGIYGVVEMKGLAIGVVPLHDDGTVTLVGQHRYPLDEYCWEIPEGGCPPEEAPEEAARRELEEETGLTAGRLEPLGGRAHLSNSVTNEVGYLFVATELTPGSPRPEGTEVLATLRLPLQEAVDMVQRGAITDSLSMIALLLLKSAGQ